MDKFTVALVSIVVVLLALPLIVSGKSKPESPADAPAAQVEAPPGTAPALVTSTPAIGATDVDPSTSEIRVTFNVPMGGGFSWTGGGEQYPETTGRPFWSDDRKTCILPVRLKPNWNYRLGLNSPSHRNFKSADGQGFPPTRFTFSTGS